MNEYKEAQKEKKRTDLEARCLVLYKQFKKVQAVKLYRSETGCGLREAMDAVDRMARSV